MNLSSKSGGGREIEWSLLSAGNPFSRWSTMVSCECAEIAVDARWERTIERFLSATWEERGSESLKLES